MSEVIEQLLEALQTERDLWKRALRNVRCILPDDAEDVEQEQSRLRLEYLSAKFSPPDGTMNGGVQGSASKSSGDK